MKRDAHTALSTIIQLDITKYIVEFSKGMAKLLYCT